MRKLIRLFGLTYEKFAWLAGRAKCPLLLAIRLYWGWQFAQDGWGKLTHLARVTEFLFAAGIASRLVSLVLFVNMTVAYLSVPDDRINFSHILSNPSDFYNATPYTYWFAALLILILGPGWVSVDTLVKRWFDKTSKA